jgi:hypothetical protein
LISRSLSSITGEYAAAELAHPSSPGQWEHSGVAQGRVFGLKVTGILDATDLETMERYLGD